MYFGLAPESASLSLETIRKCLYAALRRFGKPEKVLAVPPDFTRLQSAAGPITEMVWDFYGSKLCSVLPATGTHMAMSDDERRTMYPKIPGELFKQHSWRTDLLSLGEVPASFIEKQSEGRLSYPWPAQVNRLLVDGNFDLILSIGQVVPHEVAGMANHSKNVLIGVGGLEAINRSHFLGAVYGMERIMGRADTPVRRVLDYAAGCFAHKLPLVYVLTVRSKDETGHLATRGLFIGDDKECFQRAAELSLKFNFTLVPEPIQKAVVYLDPKEFKSTWLGNKAIYRTRMALADDADLVVLAPGVKQFGEDAVIDRLIRKHGYRTTPEVMLAVDNDPELADNLSAAGHLIHGSSEGRFRISYSPGELTREEVEQVGYDYLPLEKTLSWYDPAKLKDGFNEVNGEHIFFVSNPSLGLWAQRDRFDSPPVGVPTPEVAM